MEEAMADQTALNAIELATELTIAWLGNSNSRPTTDEVSAFLRKMHVSVTELADAGSPDADGVEGTSDKEFAPAVTARKSLASKDYIISMIDGKSYKTLRRHLSTNGLTPEQYRTRYNLKDDYPMVAANYSEARRAMAHRIGLGRKGRQTSEATTLPKAPTKRPSRGGKNG